MRLYHELTDTLVKGRLGTQHEEDCFTGGTRRRGVWFTTEPLSSPDVVRVEGAVERDLVPFEVTEAGSRYRQFVVPGKVAAGFRCTPV